MTKIEAPQLELKCQELTTRVVELEKRLVVYAENYNRLLSDAQTIHEISLCAAACPPASELDSYVLRFVKELVYRCHKAEADSVRMSVYKAIDSERNFQDRKWGTIQKHPHEVGAWLTIMRSLLTNAETAWAGSNGDYRALSELRKVIAVGVACAEQHGIENRSIHYAMGYQND